jgi:ATP-dependent DNA helicase RecQ
MVSVSRAELLDLLRTRFGHDQFRPGQERLIRDALEGRDALAVLPTGGGKSLIYQLAAQLLPGLSIVVSPLLALMKDQVDSLEALGLDVGVVSSMQSEGQQASELEEAQRGETRLLYVTPERFSSDEFVQDLKGLEISLLVIDEAHSISEWGHTFRPSYLGLADAAERLGRPTVLALTATASPWIRREIVDRLRLRNPDTVVNGIDRPNLVFEVVRVEQEREDKRVLHQLLCDHEQRLEGSGIIYTATTRAADDTAAWLREWGLSADAYHGRRRKSDRDRIQNEFMAGTLQVIAATNAFGMGVDKPDVRFVVHRDIPGSLEAYYQEAGRAGRDGQPARCVLIYRPGDLGRAAFLNASGELTREEVHQARPGMLGLGQASPRQMQEASTLGKADFARLVEILEAEGLLRRRRGRLVISEFDPDALPLEREQARRAYERSRLEMMRGYAETRDCRRAFILSYFGEELSPPGPCGRCDNDRQRAPGPVKLIDGPFAVHDQVRHPSMGEGVVHAVTEDTLTVLFETSGYKTLSLDLVLEQDLLHRV